MCNIYSKEHFKRYHPNDVPPLLLIPEIQMKIRKKYERYNIPLHLVPK
jgi:hypothetical protein